MWGFSVSIGMMTCDQVPCSESFALLAISQTHCLYKLHFVTGKPLQLLTAEINNTEHLRKNFGQHNPKHVNVFIRNLLAPN